MLRFIVVTSIVLAASTAHAQPVPGEKSENTALELSLFGTLGSYAAVGVAIAAAPNEATGYLGTAGVIGTLVAPTFGHWYAGAIVTRGMGLRAAGLVVTLVGAIADNEGCSLFYAGDNVSDEPADCGDNFRTAKGTVLMAAGAALFLGGTVDDIVTAPRRVRRYNDRLRASLTVAPVVQRDGAGLVLAGRF